MPKPKDYYTDAQGRTRPIMGKSGKGRKGTGTVVVVGALAIGLSAGGSGLLGGSGTSAVSGSAMRAKAADAAKAAAKGKHGKAWRRTGMRTRKPPRRRPDVTCAVHSYGQVQAFFTATKCRSLRRMRFHLEDDAGNPFVVWVAWVRMPTGAGAIALRELADADGTGNVKPIGMRQLQAQGVTVTGEHYESRRSRSLVVIAEAEPAGGAPSDDVLGGAAYVASRFPSP